MKIGEVDTAERVVLIAEVGNNHEGSLALAHEMIGRAHESGADAVKLQTLVPELFVSPRDPGRLQMMRRFALSLDDTCDLIEEANKHGIYVFSTPLDLRSLEVLVPVVGTMKVASGDITFTPLLEQIASSGLDTIISTGAATMQEVVAAVATLESVWASAAISPDLAILHCVSSYPASPTSVNLRAISSLTTKFPKATIGYSDHTIGIEVAALSVFAGARIVEKHFTIDKTRSEFRDHALSADPQDLRELREKIDYAETLLGTGIKQPDSSELASLSQIRRSLTVARNLKAGHRIGPDDLICQRPGFGLPPSSYPDLIGMQLKDDKKVGEVLSVGDVD